MIEIIYAPRFVRELGKLERNLQAEALEKIKSFYNPKNHKQLKVHKLHGPMRGRYSFSVNYDYRIVFSFLSKREVIVLSIGDHDIYK